MIKLLTNGKQGWTVKITKKYKDEKEMLKHALYACFARKGITSQQLNYCSETFRLEDYETSPGETEGFCEI